MKPLMTKRDIDAECPFDDKRNMHQNHAGRGNGTEGLNRLEFGADSPDGDRSDAGRSSVPDAGR